MFLLHKYKWSVDELMSQMDFNIEIQVALGIKDIEYRPFCRRTLFNFKQRLLAHYKKSGENLLERVFDYLTAEQIETLSIKTNIQRADTVLINTNIGEYSRVSLLVEVLNRVYEILDQTDQCLYAGLFEDYRQGGEKYVYSMNGGTKQEKLEKLSKVYYGVRNLLGAKYSYSPVFQLFERVYAEHFKEVKAKEEQVSIEVRPSKELGSDIVQSPDDSDATYRKKREGSYKGYTLFGAESCHPENEIDLVTKIVVATNNTDDSTILEENLEQMVAATPDLEELHVDGGFGSEGVDEIAEEKEVTIVQTAIKGRTAVAPIEVWKNEEGQIEAQCSNENTHQ